MPFSLGIFGKIQSTHKKQNPLSYYYNSRMNLNTTISLRSLVVVVGNQGQPTKDAKVSQGCWANLSLLVSREGERNPPLVNEVDFKRCMLFAYPSPLPPH